MHIHVVSPHFKFAHTQTISYLAVTIMNERYFILDLPFIKFVKIDKGQMGPKFPCIKYVQIKKSKKINL